MTLSNSSKAFAVVLVLVLAVVGLGVWWLLADTAAPQAGQGDPVEFEVAEGAGVSTLADELADAGVIRSSWAFRLAARFDERSERIQAGSHELRTGMSSDEVLAELASEPEIDTFRLTVPEGLTVDAILPRMAEAGGFAEDELVAALEGGEVELPAWVPADDLPGGAQPYEGVLFPDTYRFRDDSEPADVLQRLVDEADEAVTELEPPEDVTRYELVTVASLVEREAKVPEERPVIASVIYNRLAEPMRLQVDATVQYARGEHAERLLFEDLQVDSDWNTYERDGLPPTPIASPGRAALEAAADPDDTDYLYYVVDDLDARSHAFAETKEEHDANVREFRRMRDEREAEQDDE